MEITLIRHGEPEWVRDGLNVVDPPLTERGRLQAERVAEVLSSEQFDAVIVSPLRRARQTAAPLASRRGLTTTEFEDLEEVRLGDWALGEFRRRVAERDPEWVEWTKRRTWDGIPGAEGDRMFRDRVSSVINDLAARHRGETIAIVVHGGVIGTFLAHALDMPFSLWMTCENTSVSKVRIGPDGTYVVTVNDAHHLFDPVLRA